MAEIYPELFTRKSESPPQKNWAMVKYSKLYNEINLIYMLLSKYFLLKYKDIFGRCMTDTVGMGPGPGEVFNRK